MKVSAACPLLLLVAAVSMATPATRAQVNSPDDPGSVAAPVDAPKNLARLNCGARIEIPAANAAVSTNDNGSKVRTLLLDDQTLDYQLTAGDTSFVISLPKISLVDRFTFINENSAAKGSVHVAVSNSRLSLKDDNWQTAGRDVRVSDQRFVNVPLTGLEAKYVRVTFHFEKPATIAAIGLYGRKTLQSFSEQRQHIKEAAINIAYTTPINRSYEGLNYNFANLYAKARVIYVSSGSLLQAPQMIDDDPATGFGFGTNDLHPTTVLELNESQRLRRVSAVYEMRAGQLDIYLLERLPAGAASLDFDRLKPVVSVTDAAGTGKAAADFDPHGARYIALRWTPAQHTPNSSFKVCEIGAFSDSSPMTIGWVDVPERLMSATDITVVPSGPPVIIPSSP
ncbi:MAG: hypothetical protein ACJ8M1_02905 [Chthoniobacterales bacterium]